MLNLVKFPYYALLASSVGIELVTSSARVKSLKSQQGCIQYGRTDTKTHKLQLRYSSRSDKNMLQQ